ncbi:hypothetical protein [Streptomyces cyanogenus]|uniref:Uncharacterized protein n=1 Tax=Streptomyces cyanogenus TaxID=80860 RepID=A0ABX7U6X9_STRCY|nr:hypothetical protein [Streptomyces cyanogenus]QTE03155.1 hypothetical protein S1361_37815 [Streptomyces cyanogenus]
MNQWVTLPPEPGEEVLCVKRGSAAIPGTELALQGGLLILTNQRIYIGPWDTRLVGDLLTKIAGKLGPAGAAKAMDLVAGWANRARAVSLREILSVAPFRKSSLRITTRDGKHRDFVIAATMRSPIWSRNNAPHRDEMLAAIRQAVTSS